jgi:hypothetical protein
VSKQCRVLQKKTSQLPPPAVWENGALERNLNNCSPFLYLSIEITGAHRIICTFFAA